MEFRRYGDEGSLRASMDYERIILSLPKYVTPAHAGVLTPERNLQQGHKKELHFRGAQIRLLNNHDNITLNIKSQ